MNLAIRGIEGQIAHGDSFHNDQHPDLKASFILANPAFNVKDWGGDRPSDDQRWQYDVPPKGNANLVEPRARRPSGHDLLGRTARSRLSSAKTLAWNGSGGRPHEAATQDRAAHCGNRWLGSLFYRHPFSHRGIHERPPPGQWFAQPGAQFSCRFL